MYLIVEVYDKRRRIILCVRTLLELLEALSLLGLQESHELALYHESDTLP
jgi:hypothetical protein